MPTTLPVPFSHTINGFSKGVDQNGPFYRVIYLIDDWSLSDDFCNAVMGFSTATGPTSGPTVTRGIPHAYPLSPNLFARSAVVVDGLGNPVLNAEGYPDYDGGALVEVEYRSPPFDFGGAGGAGSSNFLNNQIDSSTPLFWYTQDLDFSTQTFTLTNSKLTYTATGKPTEVYVKFEIPITILTLTVHKLPYMPMTAMRALRGRVNNGPFLGAPTETVLFKGGKTNREPNPDGSIVQTVVMVFEERDAAHPWNSLPTADDPTFTPVAGAGGVKMYRTGDLSPLLQF